MMPSRFRFPTLLVGVLALVLIAPGAARAQSTHDLAAGKVLFDEGKKLAADGDFEAACRKFEASLELLDSLSTWGQLAMCYEKVDRKADAWGAWQRVKARTSARPEQRDHAASRIASLEPELAYLAVVVTIDTTGLEVLRDGRRVEKEELGLAVPANAGPHVITASAPGRGTFEQTITLTDGEHGSVTISTLTPEPVKAEPVKTEPVKTEPAKAEPDVITAKPLPAGPAEQPTSSGRGPVTTWIGYGAVGAGMVALAASGGLYWAADEARDDARALGCNRAVSMCHDMKALALGATAKSRATTSQALGIAGAALIGSGIVWDLVTRALSGGDERDPGDLRVGVSTTSDRFMLTLGGSL